MAHRAGLVFLRLVVSGPNWWLRRNTAERQRVALQTELVHLADLQQTWIVRPVRCVTRSAALGLDGQVLEYKGAFLFAVALVADLILFGAGP